MRMPEMDGNNFWDVYAAALESAPSDDEVRRQKILDGSMMTKNQLDQYFEGIQRSAKQRSAKANRPYSLPKHWAADQYIIQGGKCALSDITMQKGKYRGDPLSPSIDRIDSLQGYTPENCHLVALGVNISKRNLPVVDFVEMCRLVIMKAERTRKEQITNVVSTRVPNS